MNDRWEGLTRWLTALLALTVALLIGSMVASWRACAAEENDTELAADLIVDRPKDASDGPLRFPLQFLSLK